MWRQTEILSLNLNAVIGDGTLPCELQLYLRFSFKSPCMLQKITAFLRHSLSYASCF